jgi:DHA1 family tetracycline resistance protein-like MFS transporter
MPLPIVIYLQMLPATLVVPAIRPLFADYHAGGQGAMHAFMSLNMVGAALLVPIIGSWVDAGRSRRALLAALAGTDALLLAMLALPLPTGLILGLRTLEGAAHVGAATVLIAQASSRAATVGRGRAMGAAGAGLVAAIVSGSAIGAGLLAVDVRAPLVAAALLEAAVALLAVAGPAGRARARRVRPTLGESVRLLRSRRALWIPVGAAFVGRFTIGCIVVTFALFAHHHHGLSDASVGLLFVFLTLPFAAATYPAARLADRLPGGALLGGGMLVYAGALVALACVATGGLPVVMIGAGLASGVIFAGVLCQAASMAGADEHGRAMALVNVAGCIGMLLGPVVAGVTIAVASDDLGRVGAYRAVFCAAAGSAMVWLIASRRWLLAGMRPRAAAVVVAREDHA